MSAPDNHRYRYKADLIVTDKSERHFDLRMDATRYAKLDKLAKQRDLARQTLAREIFFEAFDKIES